MATAKRLYLYVVSAVGLGMVVIGSILMLGLLLDRMGLKPPAQPSLYSLVINPADKETLSVAIALAAIGLVLWIIHWGLLERIVRGTGDEAAAERASIVRSVYFSLAMATLLPIAAVLVAQTLSDVLGNVFDSRGWGQQTLNYSFNLSVVIVVLATWGYHAWIRNRDLRPYGAIGGAAAWFSRLYLYGIVFAGVMTAIFSASSLINLIGYQLAIGSPISSIALGGGSGANYWLRPELTALVGIAVGAALCGSHWIYSNRICAVQKDQGALERVSKVRFAFMMLVVLVGATAIVGGFSSGVSSLLLTVFNLRQGGIEPAWRSILFPVLAALPAFGAWLWFRRRAIAEKASAPMAFSPLRIADYVAASVGIYAIAAGSILAVSTIFNQWFNPLPSLSGYGANLSYITDAWKIGLASAAATILAGVAVWVEPWIAAQRRRNSDHTAESTSSSRSYYLHAVALFSIITGAGGAAFLLWLYTRLAVGLPDKQLGSEVSMPLALLLVTGALFAYHLATLRSDPNPPTVKAAPVPANPVAPAIPAAPAAPVPVDTPAPVAPPAEAPAPESPPADGAAG